MLIDWFTVAAQAVNFLILVWLMKRFLYQPILNAIDAREKSIAAKLDDAGKQRAEADKNRDEFKHKNDEFDQQRADLWTKATGEADAEKKRIIDDAGKAADAVAAKRQETLQSDAASLNQAIGQKMRDEVFAVSRKTLADLATSSLEERMAGVFARRLGEMESRSKQVFGEALKHASEPALLRTTFDMPDGDRAAIQKALNETFSADIHLRFETAPQLVSGIELTTNGQKLAWNIDDYLGSLEHDMADLLKKRAS